jgi:hypothetical protein
LFQSSQEKAGIKRLLIKRDADQQREQVELFLTNCQNWHRYKQLKELAKHAVTEKPELSINAEAARDVAES